jgi:hypothetical protein
MGLFNQTPPLLSGEVIRWKKPAGYSLETTAIGGTLFVTSIALVFMPNRLSSRRDWGPQRIPIDTIAKIAVQERTGTPYNGGMRRRLRIETTSGEVHLIWVKHPDEVIPELRSLTGRG